MRTRGVLPTRVQTLLNRHYAWRSSDLRLCGSRSKSLSLSYAGRTGAHTVERENDLLLKLPLHISRSACMKLIQSGHQRAHIWEVWGAAHAVHASCRLSGTALGVAGRSSCKASRSCLLLRQHRPPADPWTSTSRTRWVLPRRSIVEASPPQVQSPRVA